MGKSDAGGFRRLALQRARADCPPKASMDMLRTGKLFTWPTLIRDHTRFLSMLPGYLGAYTVPGFQLDIKIIESVMVTMNSYNTCPYCTGLHGQLARMAGADDIDESAPELAYAKVFAIEAGRGSDVDAAHGKLVDAVGWKKASSVRCLCWALLWGKTTGNSVNSARNKLMSLKLPSTLDVFILAYYGPLFAVIGVLNALLPLLPKVPPAVGYTLGSILWAPQALNIAP